MRALVRKRESTLADAIPPAVEVVSGDIGDPAACKAAVKGVDKATSTPVALHCLLTCDGHSMPIAKQGTVV